MQVFPFLEDDSHCVFLELQGLRIGFATPSGLTDFDAASCVSFETLLTLQDGFCFKKKISKVMTVCGK